MNTPAPSNDIPAWFQVAYAAVARNLSRSCQVAGLCSVVGVTPIDLKRLYATLEESERIRTVETALKYLEEEPAKMAYVLKVSSVGMSRQGDIAYPSLQEAYREWKLAPASTVRQNVYPAESYIGQAARELIMSMGNLAKSSERMGEQQTGEHQGLVVLMRRARMRMDNPGML